MVTRLVDEEGKTLAEGTTDIDTLLGSVKAREGRIKYHSTARSITPEPTPHTEDVWTTYTDKKALQYPLPVWAVDEMRLRLGRTVRYLTWKHPDELERVDAARFKLTMRMEDTDGNLIGNGLPNKNEALTEMDRDTVVLFNFQMHAPYNRGRRAEKAPRPTGRRSTSARKTRKK